MAEQTQSFSIMPVGGINVDVPPEKLDAGFTDDALNVYSTPLKIQKRPGIKKVYHPDANIGHRNNPIIDLVYYTAGGSMSTYETIFAVTCGAPAYNIPHPTHANNIWYVSLIRYAPPEYSRFPFGEPIPTTPNPPNTWWQGDINFESELIACNDELIWCLGNNPKKVYIEPDPLAVGKWRLILPVPDVLNDYRTGGYNQGFLFLTGAPDTNNVDRVRTIWGAQPDVFPSDQWVKINDNGRNRHNTGFFSMGDYAYIIQSDGFHMLTGTNNLDFRLEKVRSAYGGYGSRSCANVKGLLVSPMTVDTQVRKPSSDLALDNQDVRRHTLVDVVAIGGVDSKTIGTPIRKILMENGEYIGERTRACYDPALGIYYLLVRTTQEVTNQFEQTILLRNIDTSAWWIWKTHHNQMLSTMRFFLSGVYFGTSDGYVCTLDEELPYDEMGGETDPETNPIPSHIATSHIYVPQKERSDFVEWTKVYGEQDSGGVCELWVSKNFGDYFLLQEFALSRDGVKIPIRMNCEHIKLKIVFPVDGVRCRITEWVLGVRAGAY